MLECLRFKIVFYYSEQPINFCKTPCSLGRQSGQRSGLFQQLAGLSAARENIQVIDVTRVWYDVNTNLPLINN